MYCIVIAGIPGAGKTTLAEYLSKELRMPLISKDLLKEILFDNIGFKSRKEKVNLNNASLEIAYYLIRQLMICKGTFILENNFESTSTKQIKKLLEQYNYKPITLYLKGDYKIIYERFIKRNINQNRHPGHIVNDYYPRQQKDNDYVQLSYE